MTCPDFQQCYINASGINTAEKSPLDYNLELSLIYFKLGLLLLK